MNEPLSRRQARPTLYPAAAAVSGGECARAGDLPADDRAAPRQAPRDLRQEAERAGGRHRASSGCRCTRSSSARPRDEQPQEVFNNAAQALNHAHYWASLQARGRQSRRRRCAACSTATSAATTRSSRTSSRPPPASSAAGGRGSCSPTTSSRSGRPRTPTRRSCTVRRRSSPSMSGSTPTTSTTRTSARSTSRRWWRSS